MRTTSLPSWRQSTACSRVAKAPQSSANGLSVDERRVRLLLETMTRLAPSMNTQDVANTVWAAAETEIRTARPPRGLSWAALAKQVLANWQTYR